MCSYHYHCYQSKGFDFSFLQVSDQGVVSTHLETLYPKAHQQPSPEHPLNQENVLEGIWNALEGKADAHAGAGHDPNAHREGGHDPKDQGRPCNAPQSPESHGKEIAHEVYVVADLLQIYHSQGSPHNSRPAMKRMFCH
jgi:hypothetical protein